MQSNIFGGVYCGCEMQVIKINEKILMLIRYIFIAGLVYFIDIGVYVLLLNLGISPVFGNVAAKILATIFGFFGHRFFTYQIKNNNGMLKHAVKFFGIFLFYIPISSLLLIVLLKVIANPVAAKFICDVIMLFMTFWLNSKFTFLQENIKENKANI